MPTPHIEALPEDISKLVLMPGDPKRCEFIANTYLTSPRLVNSLRGENAYTGYYKDKMITIFSSGMGMASMGIYSHELFNDYDVNVIIRIGTAGSYVENLKVYDILLADSAYSETSYDEESMNRSLNVVNSSFDLNNKITEASKRLGIDLNIGRVHTSEALYPANISVNKYLEQNCVAVEMESFALFLNAKKFNKKASALLTISDEILHKENQMTPQEREIKLNKMITLALESIITL